MAFILALSLPDRNVYTALAADTKDVATASPTDTCFETDTGDEYEFNGAEWKKIGTTTSSGEPAGLVVTGPGSFVMPGGGALDVKSGGGILVNGDINFVSVVGVSVTPDIEKIHSVLFDTADLRDTVSIVLTGDEANYNDSYFMAIIQGIGSTKISAQSALQHTTTVTEVTPGVSGENDIIASNTYPILLNYGTTSIIPVDFSILRVDITIFSLTGATALTGKHKYKVEAWKR